jgi:hypothetical protein
MDNGMDDWGNDEVASEDDEDVRSSRRGVYNHRYFLS